MGEFQLAKASGLLTDGFEDYEEIGEEGDDTEWVIWRAVGAAKEDGPSESAVASESQEGEAASEEKGPREENAVPPRKETGPRMFPELGSLQTESGNFVDLYSEVLSKRGLFLFSYSRCTLLSVLKYPWDKIKRRGYEIYGIGSENMKIQLAEKEKFGYPHNLICDTSKAALGKLDLLKFDGRVHSSYFFIEQGGRILMEEKGNTPKNSIKAVEEFLKAVRAVGRSPLRAPRGASTPPSPSPAPPAVVEGSNVGSDHD
jgi:hypothetical protein